MSETCKLKIDKGCLPKKQAERLKSRERRAKVDRLDGQWAQWFLGLMVNRLDF